MRVQKQSEKSKELQIKKVNSNQEYCEDDEVYQNTFNISMFYKSIIFTIDGVPVPDHDLSSPLKAQQCELIHHWA